MPTILHAYEAWKKESPASRKAAIQRQSNKKLATTPAKQQKKAQRSTEAQGTYDDMMQYVN